MSDEIAGTIMGVTLAVGSIAIGTMLLVPWCVGAWHIIAWVMR